MGNKWGEREEGFEPWMLQFHDEHLKHQNHQNVLNEVQLVFK